MIKLTGLWKNEGKKGTYFTGYLGDAKIMIFENGYKTGEKQPDYIMYLDEKKQKKEDDAPKGDAFEDALPSFDDALPFN